MKLLRKKIAARLIKYLKSKNESLHEQQRQCQAEDICKTLNMRAAASVEVLQ